MHKANIYILEIVVIWCNDHYIITLKNLLQISRFGPAKDNAEARPSNS